MDTSSMTERMLAGQLYRAGDPALEAARHRAQTLLAEYNASTQQGVRRELLANLLGSLGEGVELRSPFWCDYGTQIHVGDGVFANFGLIVLDVCEVRIGDRTQIGPNVQISAADHPRDPALRAAGWENGRPVTVGADVWIGAGAIVCPGVTIGDGAVIGAGSVVTRDVPPGVVAVGNPCRVLREATDVNPPWDPPPEGA